MDIVYAGIDFCCYMDRFFIEDILASIGKLSPVFNSFILGGNQDLPKEYANEHELKAVCSKPKPIRIE